MNVFDLDRSLVRDYERFARSFTQIRAPDIRTQVEKVYASARFWPEPLISINPHFERAASVADLAADGTLYPDTARVFRVDGHPIRFHRHQAQAIAKAVRRQSFAVTTGTGSGKSLCFFVPIIDAAIRARVAREAARTRAIVVYPMNALANSQVNELEKFLDQSELPERLRPTFARYTGQESQEERQRIREAKPDVLLTNFMMLEQLAALLPQPDNEPDAKESFWRPDPFDRSVHGPAGCSRTADSGSSQRRSGHREPRRDHPRILRSQLHRPPGNASTPALHGPPARSPSSASRQRNSIAAVSAARPKSRLSWRARPLRSITAALRSPSMPSPSKAR